MKELLSAVQTLTEEENARAAAKFGSAHNSMHEAYAVILEEFEEARFEEKEFESAMEWFWLAVKTNSTGDSIAGPIAMMLEKAECAAAEWIQVAAMCRKAME